MSDRSAAVFKNVSLELRCSWDAVSSAWWVKVITAAGHDGDGTMHAGS